jgi:hypothetical protein
VEAALVLPIVFFLLYAIMIGGLMVFKNQEVAYIARETARYASVHGAQYAKVNAAKIAANTLPNVNKAYLTSYAQGKALTIPGSDLSVSVQMSVIKPGTSSGTTPTPETVAWGNADTKSNSPYSTWTNSSTSTTELTNNLVIVTVTYTWNPGIYFLGSVTLSSTSTMPMSY